MADKLPINSVTIQDICESYGFAYRCDEEGRHFATVGGEEVEIKFREDGSLPRGRHAFVGTARKASAAFLADYPPAAQSQSKTRGGAVASSAKQTVKDLRNLLRKFELDQFEEIQSMVAEVREEKRREVQFREERKVLKGKIEELEKDLATFASYGCPAPEALAGQLARAKERLAELS